MQTFPHFSRSTSRRQAAMRFIRVQHLTSGETCMRLSETSRSYEDRPRFGPAGPSRGIDTGSHLAPAEWMALMVDRLAGLAGAHGRTCPLLVPMPLAALLHADTAMFCSAAVRRHHLRPQDIYLDLRATSLAVQDTLPRLNTLRHHGFRLSVNATQPGAERMPLDRLDLIDSLRFDIRQLDRCMDLNGLVDAAHHAGVMLIAEHAAWRDGDWLARLGIHHAIRPRADA